MSPDETFAAQMWSWPDPVLKRDAMGRILFVNAAFLIAHGGQVDDWHGNTVMGWPAPTSDPYPNRFETRVPNGQGETVFDWIEHAMMDGAAMAIARDVTALKSTANPVPAQIPTQIPQEPAPAASLQALAQTAPVNTQAPQPHTQHAAAQAQATSMPAAPQAQAQDPSSLIPSQHGHMPPSQMAPQDSGRSDERDFERRALPIETDSAILGNNWKDAVIAKAVGVDAEEDTQAPAATLQSGAQPATGQAMDPQNSNDGARVLLAEDNAINALLTRTLLEAEGCIVDVVEDGALAVDAVRQSNYDMIFMDMRMPNMDGLEATRKIRTLNERSKSLPIIALTANAFDDDRNACFDSGMNDFMTKPVSAEELTAMVKTWTTKTPEGGQKRMAS